MPTQSEMIRASANAMARRFAVDAADGLCELAHKAVDTAESMLKRLEEAGAKPEQITDLRKLLLDTIGDIQGRINRMVDNEGEETDLHQVDVSGLERLPPDEPLFGDIRRLRVP